MDGQTKVLNTHAIEYLLMWTYSFLEGTGHNSKYKLLNQRFKKKSKSLTNKEE